jgi:N utilization substance protein A
LKERNFTARNCLFEIGEEVSEEVKLIDLGRRAILALRQNLISKIHEHDNTNLTSNLKI